MKRTLQLTCLMITMLMVSDAAAQAVRAGKKPPRSAELTAALQRFVDQGEIAGAVTLVAHEGKIVHLGAVGLADLASGREMKNNTLFAIASMTKPIVATAVMQLQDEGKLRLEDPVAKYLPEFAQIKLKSGEPLARPITIRDLLTHTSGLGGEQAFKGSLPDEAVLLAQRSLDFQPGARWQYGPGITVAGRIVEVVSGQSLPDYLQARIFGPLQMKNTTFSPTGAQLPRIASLYGPGEAAGKLVVAPNWLTPVGSTAGPNPSGGLYSTARDLFRFYQMVLNRGTWRGQQIVSADAVRQMTTLQTGELTTGFTPGNGWGLGWCIVREPQGVSAALSAGSFGHGGAFGTQGWVDPVQQRVYVLLLQRTQLPNSDASEMRKTLHDVGRTIQSPAGESVE